MFFIYRQATTVFFEAKTSPEKVSQLSQDLSLGIVLLRKWLAYVKRSIRINSHIFPMTEVPVTQFEVVARGYKYGKRPLTVERL